MIAETDGSVASGPMPAPVVIPIAEPTVPMLPSGVERERRKGQRRRALPAEAAGELMPAEGERRRTERRRKA